MKIPIFIRKLLVQNHCNLTRKLFKLSPKDSIINKLSTFPSTTLKSQQKTRKAEASLAKNPKSYLSITFWSIFSIQKVI